MTTTPTAEPSEATAAAHTAIQQPTAPVAAPAQTLSILALVLGLIAFVGVGFPAAVAALVLGALAWSREPRAHTLALIGMIAAGVSLAGGVIFGILGFAFAVPFLAAIPFWGAF